MYIAVYIVLLVSYITVVFYLARKAGEPVSQLPSSLTRSAA
jgi:hypothetical protein